MIQWEHIIRKIKYLNRVSRIGSAQYPKPDPIRSGFDSGWKIVTWSEIFRSDQVRSRVWPDLFGALELDTILTQKRGLARITSRDFFVFWLNISLPFEYLRLCHVSVHNAVTSSCFSWTFRCHLSIWDFMSRIGIQCRDSFVFWLNILLPFEYLRFYVTYQCTMLWLCVLVEYFTAIWVFGILCRVLVRNADYRIFHVSLYNHLILKLIRILP